MQQCLTQLSQSGAALYQAIGLCVQQVCPNAINGSSAEQIACIRGSCTEQFQACEMEGVQPGAGPCSALTTCYNGCGPTNADCQRGCRAQASAEANATLQAYFSAPAKLCQSQECLNTACAAEFGCLRR